MTISKDLAWRAVYKWFYRGETLSKVGRDLLMDRDTVKKIVHRFERGEEPSVQGNQQRLRKAYRKLSTTELAEIKRFLENNASSYLDELCDLLFQSLGVRVSISTMCRGVRDIGFTRKQVRRCFVPDFRVVS